MRNQVSTIESGRKVPRDVLRNYLVALTRSWRPYAVGLAFVTLYVGSVRRHNTLYPGAPHEVRWSLVLGAFAIGVLSLVASDIVRMHKWRPDVRQNEG